jgi:hypothetical protein
MTRKERKEAAPRLRKIFYNGLHGGNTEEEIEYMLKISDSTDGKALCDHLFADELTKWVWETDDEYLREELMAHMLDVLDEFTERIKTRSLH